MATYYVKNSGLDSNTGLSDAQAWQTISKINSITFSVGDQILFNKGDSWREMLTIPSSGIAGNYITFSSYGTSSNKPKILGSTKAITWSNLGGNKWSSLTSVSDPMATYFGSTIFYTELGGIITWGNNKKVYDAGLTNLTQEYDWTWNTNTIYIFAATDPDSRYTSIEVPQRQMGIFLNQQEYITIDGFEIQFHQLAGIEEASSNDCGEGLKIKNCDISYNSYKNFEGKGIECRHSNALIQNCVIHDVGRRGIAMDCSLAGANVHNVTVEYCTLYNGSHTTGCDFNAGPNSTIDSIIIRNNFIYDDPVATLVAPYSYIANQLFLRGDRDGTFTNCFIYNNIFKYTNANSIHMIDVDDVYIYNNTFYGVNPNSDEPADINIQGYEWTGYADTKCTNVNIKNNIFYGNEIGAVGIVISKNPISEVHVDYNLHWQEYTGAYGSTAYLVRDYVNNKSYNREDIAALRTDLGWEIHSPEPSDPLFVSSSDYTLQSGSPAIAAGIAVGINIDFAGNVWNTSPSIGAYEYGSNPPTTTIAPTTTSGELTLIEGTWLTNRTILNEMFQILYSRFG